MRNDVGNSGGEASWQRGGLWKDCGIYLDARLVEKGNQVTLSRRPRCSKISKWAWMEEKTYEGFKSDYKNFRAPLYDGKSERGGKG